ncbi:hypothetical protein [Thiorhodospira sibirica]|uniref:hypothetical protein n=1 Tax=Thiorhodospira sibirica TaxID=154347 RepID=UPI00022C58AC|nr:hypothetical protein [Thiorhodospira sibirica]
MLLLRSIIIGGLFPLPLLLWLLPVSWFIVLLPAGIALALALAWHPAAASQAEATNIGRNFRFLCGSSVFLFIVTISSLMLVDEHDAFWLGVTLGTSTTITMLIPLLVLNYQLKKLTQLINGKNLLAHWFIEKNHWHHFVEHDYQQRRKEMLERIGISGAIMLIAMIGSIIYVGKLISGDSLIIELGVYGLLAAVFAGAILYPRRRRYRLLQGPREVWIGLQGMCIGRQASWWCKGRFFGPQFYLLEIKHLDNQQAYINLFYFMKKYEKQQQLVPVQKDCEEQAQSIIKEISLFLKISQPAQTK